MFDSPACAGLGFLQLVEEVQAEEILPAISALRTKAWNLHPAEGGMEV